MEKAIDTLLMSAIGLIVSLAIVMLLTAYIMLAWVAVKIQDAMAGPKRSDCRALTVPRTHGGRWVQP